MSPSRSTVLACAIGFVLGASATWAQPQLQKSRREPQLENDQVTVWKSTVMPKQPLALHRHDHGRVLVALTDGQLQVVDRMASSSTATR